MQLIAGLLDTVHQPRDSMMRRVSHALLMPVSLDLKKRCDHIQTINAAGVRPAHNFALERRVPTSTLIVRKKPGVQSQQRNSFSKVENNGN
jgi:hypothetical protein